jgi:putative spermidine/putrescine transport system permease protein
MLLAMAFIAPLALFLLVTFFVPIILLLLRAFTDHEVRTAWPATAAAMHEWDGKELPPPRIVASFVSELATSRTNGTLMAAATRLNHALPGARTLLSRTAEALPLPGGSTPLSALQAIDPRWSEPQTWSTIRQASGAFTEFYLLAALDRRVERDGAVRRVPDEQAIFIDVFARTFWISAVVTALCALLGYPLAYTLARLPNRFAHPLLVLVLLPFWTSVLVRTAAWMVLLQENGAINGLLASLGWISHPLELIYNRTGVYIALTHVLLPYFVLPLYAVMKRLPPTTMRAALSLGATPWQAFWRVYFIQTLPGAAAGALMVFILALGYYITPALVGGPADQLISYFIAFYTNQSLNWGMAAALSLLLLVTTLLLLVVSGKLSGRRELVPRW